MISDPLFWLVSILGVFLTGISKSGFAGGAGVVAVPLMALVMPLEQSVAIMLPLLIIMDIKMVRIHWRHVPWPVVKSLLPGAILGISAGGLAMQWLNASLLMLLLGTLSIVFTAWGTISQKIKHHYQSLKNEASSKRSFLSPLSSPALWGGFSGLTSTLLHAGGPPIHMYLLLAQLQKHQWLAITAVFFAVMNWIKVVPYSLNNAWDGSVFWVTLLLAPVAYMGILTGHSIAKRLSEEIFMRVCRGLLFLSGVGLWLKVLFS